MILKRGCSFAGHPGKLFRIKLFFSSHARRGGQLVEQKTPTNRGFSPIFKKLSAKAVFFGILFHDLKVVATELNNQYHKKLPNQ
jgi:hypothetical protein